MATTVNALLDVLEQTSPPKPKWNIRLEAPADPEINKKFLEKFQIILGFSFLRLDNNLVPISDAATETVGPSGLPRLTFEVTSNQKVQIPLYYLKILTFERMLRNL